jgi:putative ABC transport system permease protein
MRQSLRAFQAQPGFSASVVVVLGLCIGLNSALFTVVNALLLRPLPFPRSEQLVEIAIPEGHTQIDDLAGARSIESVGAFLPWNFAVAGPDGVHLAYGFRVTPNLIPLLQIRPAFGRSLASRDFGGDVAMIGYDYWKTLGAHLDIAGQTLSIDGRPYFIAGVLPADFFLEVRDVKLIVSNLSGSSGRTIARLRSGSTPAQAQAELAPLVKAGRVQVTPLARALHSDDRRPVLFLLATAGFVLLITCANLANLQLARGLARRREFAIRTALGASHGRLVLQLAGECALLAAAGAALGLVITRALHDEILVILPLNIARRLAGADALPLDARVIAFTAAIALAAMLLFGLLPALSSLRFDVMARLSDAARGSSRERRQFGQALVAAEIALALMLLSGASLAFKNLTQLQSQYLGFRPEKVLRVMTDFSATRYPRPDRKAALFEEVRSRIGRIPGVASVGMVAPQAFPFGGPGVSGSPFEIFGKPAAEARAEVYSANREYLDSIHLPLLRGRWFTDADTLSSLPVSVVSETVARRYWDGECVGRRVRLNSDRAGSNWTTIVGVVGDVKNPIADHWQPTAYRPFAQTPSSGAVLMIRSLAGDPQALAPSVRRELHSIDPTAPEARIVQALDLAIRDYVSPQRFTTVLLAVFAAIGLALAAAGVYGVMRCWTASMTGEIGIRLALGAQPSNVLRLVLGRATVTAAFGVAAGVVGAIALRKVMATQLIGVSAADPVVLGSVATVLFGVALLAGWLPAIRASRIDPLEALRSE